MGRSVNAPFDMFTVRYSPAHSYSSNVRQWVGASTVRDDLLFTAAGTYFSTSKLTYIGTFNIGGAIRSMSRSSALQEAAELRHQHLP
jgi:hypothetical protein